MDSAGAVVGSHVRATACAALRRLENLLATAASELVNREGRCLVYATGIGQLLALLGLRDGQPELTSQLLAMLLGLRDGGQPGLITVMRQFEYVMSALGLRDGRRRARGSAWFTRRAARVDYRGGPDGGALCHLVSATGGISSAEEVKRRCNRCSFK